MSKELIDIASDMVVWNDRIITDAARKLARGDHTATRDIIEFDTDQPASARKSHR